MKRNTIVPWCGFMILNFGLHAQTRALTLTPNHFPSKVLATDWNLFCSTFLQNPYPSTLSTNEMCQFFQLQSPFASCKMQDWFTELMQHFKIVYGKQSTQMRKYLSDSFSFCLFRSVCLLARGLKNPSRCPLQIVLHWVSHTSPGSSCQTGDSLRVSNHPSSGLKLQPGK